MEDNKPRRNVPTFSRRSGDENDEIKREIKAAGRERTRRVSSLYGTGYEENPKPVQKKETGRTEEDVALEPVEDDDGNFTLAALVAKRLESKGQKKAAEKKRAGIIEEIAHRKEAREATTAYEKPKKTLTNPFAQEREPEKKALPSFKRAASNEEQPVRTRTVSTASTISYEDFGEDDVPVFRSRTRKMGEASTEENIYQESKPVAKEPKSRKQKNSQKKSKLTYLGRFGACVGGLLGVVLIFLIGVLIIVNRGPSIAFRDQFVMTVSESSAGSFLSTMFLPSETIDKIREENAIKTNNVVSSGEDVVISTPAPDQKPLELIDISGKTFTGKLLIVADPGRVFIGTPPNGYGSNKEGMKTIDMASYYNAIAAINGGGFYDTGKGNGGVPTGRQNSDGIVIHDGKMLWGNKGTTYEIIGIDSDKKLVLGKMTGQQAMDRGIQEALNFGPYLIVDGEPQAIGSAMTEGGLNPRSAIGQRKDGAMLLLVINGRQPNSLGASYDDLIAVMLKYGAVNAANLDGGSSSYMVWENEIITTCASLYGPRKMATSILVRR